MEVLAELSAREPIFHRPELGTNFEQQTVSDFWEVGASGKVYQRDFVLQELRRRTESPRPDVWKTSGFQCRALGPQTYLVTYLLVQDGVRRTRRATIWERTSDGWKIVYHQGTVISD